LACVSACGKNTVSTTLVLPASGRSYEVTTARTHDAKRPAPVLFSLHAYATEPGVIDDSLGLAPVAVEQRGYILVTPRGHVDSHGNPFWNATRACCDAERKGPDDLGYLRAVLADVRRRYAVDPARVYAVGISNGGFMAQRWACEPGGDLAGILSISGVGPGAPDPVCQPSRPITVVQIHGDADDVIRYAGGVLNGYEYPAVARNVEAWTKLAGCPAAREPASKEWLEFGLSVVDETWSCANASVTHWRVRSGAHNLRLRVPAFTRALERLEALAGRTAASP
jgi:polyhydroxybutyrate depolymerase